MRIVGDVFFVRNQYNGIAARLNLAKDVHDFNRRFGIEVTGRFIGQNDRRVIYEGAGNGHTLTLTTAELIGFVMTSVGKTHFFQYLHGHFSPEFLTGMPA